MASTQYINLGRVNHTHTGIPGTFAFLWALFIIDWETFYNFPFMSVFAHFSRHAIQYLLVVLSFIFIVGTAFTQQRK